MTKSITLTHLHYEFKFYCSSFFDPIYYTWSDQYTDVEFGFCATPVCFLISCNKWDPESVWKVPS